MISGVVFAALTEDAAVAALVAKRVYPQDGPADATYPLITYQMVSPGIEDTRTLRGPTRHFRTLYQIDIFGRKQIESEQIAAAVRAVFDGKSNQTWGGLTIAASLFDNQFDGNFEPNPNLHRIIQQYRIVYAS